MSIIDDVRKNAPLTPFYAAVGVTDLAVEKVRDARARAEHVAAQVREDLTIEVTPETVKELPALALNQGLVLAGKVAEGYDDLALRGKRLVARLRDQQATQDLLAQAETTVAMGKGAVTTAKKAVTDVERSAKATLTTATKEASKVAETIASSVQEEGSKVASTLAASVQEEAKVAKEAVSGSVKRTRTAAKRTASTTRNAAKKTTTRAKATTTSARKTAAASTKAVEKAAEKVGD